MTILDHPHRNVVRFPDERRMAPAVVQPTPAAVIILPVIRIERHVEAPCDCDGGDAA